MGNHFTIPGAHGPGSSRPAHATLGFLQMEALFGLLIVGFLLSLLAALAVRQNAALLKFREIRTAVRQAEVALTQLQTGQAVDNPQVKILRLQDKSPVVSAPEKGALVWVRLEVPVPGKSPASASTPVHLVGLVPASTLTGFMEVPHGAETE